MSGVRALHRRIADLGAEAGAAAVAVAFHDYAHRTGWAYQPDRWFHAASTIKVPVLLGVYDAIERGRFQSHDLVHVRNRFVSVGDGRPYRIEPDRDPNPEVHAEVGGVMRIHDLARHMIVTSSNLATNVLVELLGLDAIQETLDRLRLHGIELRRGVEDMAAWERDINNRVTAEGLVSALRTLVAPGCFSPEQRIEILGILHAQEFRSGIPAGLPEEARVAHKTGEISTVTHDAGIVYLPDREPWVVAILTEWEPEASGRRRTIAAISRMVYEYLTDGEGAAAGDAERPAGMEGRGDAGHAEARPGAGGGEDSVASGGREGSAGAGTGEGGG